MHSTLLTRDGQLDVSIRRLRNCQLFDGMDDVRLAEVARLCTWHKLEAEQMTEGRPDETFFIICHGKLRVSALSANGREIILTDFGPGEHFGVITRMDTDSAALQVQALEPTLLASLTREDLTLIIRDDTVFREGLLQTQQCVTERLVKRLIELGTLKISGRLYSYLLQLGERAGVVNNQATIRPAPLHMELGARIAASREEVSRELARLRKQGLISSSRHALVLLDVAGLKERLQRQ